MMNTRIQSLVKSEYRGRVMSIYVFMFLGLTPIGSFEVGWLSEKMGTGFALSTGAVIVFIFAFFVFLRRNKITAAFDEYEKGAKPVPGCKTQNKAGHICVKTSP
jgi:hypothetical protein